MPVPSKGDAVDKPTRRDRQRALRKLQGRIKARHARMRPPQGVWFWPVRHGVQGFLGTGPIMVVGLNPASRDAGRARAPGPTRPGGGPGPRQTAFITNISADRDWRTRTSQTW
jgi:hypothetical protein